MRAQPDAGLAASNKFLADARKRDTAGTRPFRAGGVSVSATYRDVVVGTPTYGNDATAPVLTVRVEVDDAAIRAQVPGFDGREQVFVRGPKLKSGGTVWESHALASAAAPR